MFLGTHSPKLDEKGRLFLPGEVPRQARRRAGGHPGAGALPLRLPDGRVRPGRRAAAVRAGDQQGGPRLPARVPRPAPATRCRTSRAGSPSRPCCASTPGWPATAPSSAPAPGSRSGTPPPGTTTWRPASRPSPSRRRRWSPDCSDRATVARRRPDPSAEVSTRSRRPGAPSPVPGRDPSERLGTWPDGSSPGPAARAPRTTQPSTHEQPSPTTARLDPTEGHDAWHADRRRRARGTCRSCATRVVALLAPGAAASPASVVVDAHARPGRARRGAAGGLPGRRPGRPRPRPARRWRLAGERLAPFGDRVTPGARGLRRAPRGARPARPRTGRRACCFDLGVSSLQLDEADRGFAYRVGRAAGHADGPDARTDRRRRPQHLRRRGPGPGPARVRRGAVRPADRRRRRARARPRSRSRRRPGWSSCVRDAIPAATRRTGGNPAKRTFQALRIEVNGELDALAARPAGRGRRAGRRRPDRRAGLPLARGPASSSACSRRRRTSSAPPDLPVELPEHAPYLRLLTRGAEVPDDDEVRDQPAGRLGAAAGGRADPAREGAHEPDPRGRGATRRVRVRRPPPRPPAVGAARPARAAGRACGSCTRPPSTAGAPPSSIGCCCCSSAGCSALLLLNTALAQGSFALHDLQERSDELGDQQQALRQAIDAAGRAGAARRPGQALGMVPSQGAGVRRLPDGRMVGVAKRATAAPTPTVKADDGHCRPDGHAGRDGRPHARSEAHEDDRTARHGHRRAPRERGEGGRQGGTRLHPFRRPEAGAAPSASRPAARPAARAAPQPRPAGRSTGPAAPTRGAQRPAVPAARRPPSARRRPCAAPALGHPQRRARRHVHRGRASSSACSRCSCCGCRRWTRRRWPSRRSAAG